MTTAFGQGMSLGPQPQFLPPDVLAQYESAFGVMVINGSSDAIMSGAAPELIEAINHETFHHLQTVCTGYGLARAEAIRAIVIRHLERATWRDLRTNYGWMLVQTVLRWLPGVLRRWLDAPRLERMVHVALISNRRSELAANVPAGDPSLAAADLPGMFEALDELRAELWQPRDAGVADVHVIEGAAVAFSVMVTTAAQEGSDVLVDDDGAVIETRIDAAAAQLGEEYGVLMSAARAAHGRPTAPWLVPASALAMRYAHPGAAVLPLLERLRPCPIDTIVDAARTLANALPEIPGAGDRLGTARDVYQRGSVAAHVHEQALAALGGDGPDEITALCDPLVFGDLPPALLTCVMRFNDRVGAIGLTAADAAVRVAAANLALRAQSRRRFEREVDRELVHWAHHVMVRAFGGPSAEAGEVRR